MYCKIIWWFQLEIYFTPRQVLIHWKVDLLIEMGVKFSRYFQGWQTFCSLTKIIKNHTSEALSSYNELFLPSHIIDIELVSMNKKGTSTYCGWNVITWMKTNRTKNYSMVWEDSKEVQSKRRDKRNTVKNLLCLMINRHIYFDQYGVAHYIHFSPQMYDMNDLSH